MAAVAQKMRRALGRRRITKLVNAKEPTIAPITVTMRRSHFGPGAPIRAHCSSRTIGMWKT